MSSRMNHLLLSLGVALLLACGSDKQPEPVIADGIFAPLGAPRPSATPEQLEAFEKGLEVARHRFTREEGLGPGFNTTFCGGCHEKPVFGGSAGHYRDFALIYQNLDDGSQVPLGQSGVLQQFTLDDAKRLPSPEGINHSASRNPIPFFGLGLLAEIPEDEILRRADPEDADGDGISGRPNYDRGFVGRFGRKAQTVSIEGFIRGPLFNHVGITSNPLSEESKAALPVPSSTIVAPVEMALEGEIAGIGLAQAAAPDEPIVDDDDAADPELSEEDLFNLVSFAMLLGAPEPDAPTEASERGRALFDAIGCADCHTPALEGPRGLIPAYTDLLLHDMGEDLADGVRMKVAEGNEFRTQPLWGVTAVGPYLHDGRADTLDEAIRLHGGESERSKDGYEALTDSEQQDVLAFLHALGGSAQKTEGLIPPDAGIPSLGTPGAPRTELDETGRALFLEGRAVFDRDMGVGRGLGPRFNGDACRACHFEPVPGGAGPIGLDVTRHGIVSGDVFTAPAIGTMAHRLQLTPERPPFDQDANVVELRQTPTLLGLGLLEQIPAETLLSMEDPDDLDADGISGRVHMLDGGLVGRLGWKANVPNLAEFARDAMFNEMGITLPDQAGLTFGGATDSDDIPDPEISTTDLERLTFFMRELAPPARQRVDEPNEDLGELIFTAIGCASCHVPALATADGEMVHAYTDLLLHDVAPTDYLGIEDGQATMREFRTPPLWGIRDTAPYMHDGRAFTLEEAIVRHESEGQASSDAYGALTAEERSLVLAFLRSL